MEPIIKISFDDDGFFFPGQTVKGYVEVSTPKVMLVKVIKLRALGCAKVIWHASEHAGEEKVQYSQTEEYYTMRFNLFGNGSVASHLNAGTHQYKFEFVLPEGVPSSFESQYGYVRHTCTVFLQAERENFFECKRTAPFSVGSSLDLNQNPFALEPILMSEEKALCCLCCAQGHISFSVNIDHSGYVPGENVVINAECVNESSNSTESTCAEIVQKITYKAQSSTKKSNNIICSKTHPGTGPGGNDIWFGEMLKIPPVPPTGLQGCSLIDISYELRFAFIPSGLSTRLSTSSELIIGAIPVRQSFMAFKSQARNPPAPSHPQVPPPPYPVSNPGFGVPQPPMGIPHVPSAPVLGFDGMPQQPTIIYPGPQHPPANPYNYPLNPPPYPWAYIYPDLAPPTYQKSAQNTDINLLDFDENDFANARRCRGAEPVFVPRYVTYISNC